jgi:hypothetical protein
MTEESFLVKETKSIVCHPLGKFGKTYCFVDYGSKGKDLLFADESLLVENAKVKIYFDGTVEIQPLDKDKELVVKYKKDTDEYIVTSV